MMRRTREFAEALQALLLEAAQPFAGGGDGGPKQAGGGFDAALPRGLNQTQAMIIGVAHFTNQDEIGSGHGGHCSRAPWPPGLVGAVRPARSSASHSNTSTSPEGYDVGRLYQKVLSLALAAVHGRYCLLPLAAQSGNNPRKLETAQHIGALVV